MDIIQAVTKDCRHDTCRIMFPGGGTSTLMGWTPIYDRNGKQLNDDPNIHTSSVNCQTCRRRWTVTTQEGKTTITEQPKAMIRANAP